MFSYSSTVYGVVITNKAFCFVLSTVYIASGCDVKVATIDIATIISS